MSEFEPHFPGDIPQGEWTFLESIRQFGENVAFIIDEQSMDIADKVCESLYKTGLPAIQNILDNPNMRFFVIPFNPHNTFEEGISRKIEEELQKRVFVQWKDFFIKSTVQGNTVHKQVRVEFFIKYGTIPLAEDNIVHGIIFIKKVDE